MTWTSNVVRATLPVLATAASLLIVSPAFAGPDRFGTGRGQDGSFTVPAAGATINAYSHLTGDVTSGASALTIDDATQFDVGELVLVWQTSKTYSGRHSCA